MMRAATVDEYMGREKGRENSPKTRVGARHLYVSALHSFQLGTAVPLASVMLSLQNDSCTSSLYIMAIGSLTPT
jgi:hypothetical protein